VRTDRRRVFGVDVLDLEDLLAESLDLVEGRPVGDAVQDEEALAAPDPLRTQRRIFFLAGCNLSLITISIHRLIVGYNRMHSNERFIQVRNKIELELNSNLNKRMSYQ
jgi:hypothetical protein